MKSLAEYIVKSPGQAAVVVAFTTASLLLSWVGAAALALYVLRFGLSAAMPVVLAALVPAVFWSVAGDIGPILTHAGVLILATVLRGRAGWPELLTMLPVVLTALCVLVLIAAPDYVQALQTMSATFVEQFKQQLIDSNPADAELSNVLQGLRTPSGEQLMGMIALLQAATVLVSLLIARWWQAMLYNPGGFKQEFHSLRLGRVQVLLLVGCFVGLLGNDVYSVWGWVFILPIAVAGIALVHGLLGIANAASRWLILFYAALILVRPTLGILVALAVMDSALNFRSRLQQRLG